MLIVQNPDLLRQMNAPRRTAALALSMRAWPRPRRNGLGDSTPLNYLPAGTQLVYTLTGSPEAYSDWTGALSAIGQNISSNSGIMVVGSSLPNAFLQAFYVASSTVSITVQLSKAYTSAQMVQQVLDSASRAVLSDFDSSSISVSNIPASSTQGASQILSSTLQGSAPVGVVPGAATAASLASQDSSGSPSPNWWATNWTWAVPAGIAVIAGAYVIGRVL